MDDEQVKNAMSEIKSQLRSASGAELARLSIAVGGLLNSAISPEIENQVKDLQAVVDQRAQEVELAQSSQNISSGARGRNDGGADKDLDTLAAISDKIYEQFLLTHEKDLAEKKKDTQNLSELEEAAKAGKPISEELKKKVLKTPEQIKAAQESNQRVAEAEKAAKEEVKRCKAAVAKLREDLDKASSPDEREKIRDQIDHLQERQIKAQEVITETTKHFVENRKQLEHLDNAEKIATGDNKKFVSTVRQQKKEEISSGLSAVLEEKEKNMSLGGHAEQSHSQATRKEMVKNQKEHMENSEDAAKLMNAFKKHQPNATPPLQTSAPLSPPVTPSVNGPASKNMGPGGRGS